MRSLVLNQKLVLFLLASDFPSENPRTQNRTILIRNVGNNIKKHTVFISYLYICTYIVNINLRK
jgi:hypothetical protein